MILHSLSKKPEPNQNKSLILRTDFIWANSSSPDIGLQLPWSFTIVCACKVLFELHSNNI